MKKTATVIISSALGMSLLAVAPVFAQQGPQQDGNQGPRPGVMRIWGHRGDDRIRAEIRADIRANRNTDDSTNRNGSENNGKPLLPGMVDRPLQVLVGMGLVQGKGQMIGRSVGGKVTAVSAPNFTLELPRVGDKATTTVTVTTNASTTFLLGKNSASISDVAVGGFALVAGPFASSTQTITALRVNLSTSTPPRGQEVRIEVREAVAERLENRFGTSAPRGFVREVVDSVFQGFARFFGR
ncbi:hypothetical protein A3C20_01880 [Candidatus Kaiserbacteria bacterium RIFCSPHIGHO2_02_FULL_55_25]|uniref:DUF5666 domain-containing protein n=1 Tax=Candidatus Kaiserbacteria bacterium RIFCSPHIGHO2_02_FULL_55_25 TaxID=1798498 RepID=A0A1F6E460_9BACT|nr:MAG: hypothetical protein A2764_00145 [Candidatus Kaiserbacteria bacterium RIFCSPHIGHO2_01_FULL_55_79]OGG68463.1 MAG: hypothetical protein A3C20_01880 [Candidatus Kaiserbacteria bacterium RIFCSPHIGHO2_02_FULL_55_25]OGG78401.1 MAG: hypothetical protein A3F56_03160 [Candidatus Kaiserbacteria bacterium RIFCSPHIGHO2_12_FULL_55_13]OGG82747.1 MAG: hypothetical protein A3A42_02685 [Candidatus Kaiserbacteria bacterium RIFCSPLOWO2_01_FULL_55_25]